MIHPIICQRNNPTNSQTGAPFWTYLASFRSPHHYLWWLNLCSSRKWGKFLWLVQWLIADYCMLCRLKLEMIPDRVINHRNTLVISDSSDSRLIVSVQSKINVTLILGNYGRSTWDNNFRCLCDSNWGKVVLFNILQHALWVGVLMGLFVKSIVSSVKINHYWRILTVIHSFIVHHSCPNTFFHLVFSSRWVHSTLLPLDFLKSLICSPVHINVSFKHLNLSWF